MSPHGEARLVTEERWHHISRLVNEAFGKSETRMLALRKRIIARFKPKLSDGKVKVEPNLFGGYDLRQSDVKLVRCEKAARETECRVVQEGQKR